MASAAAISMVALSNGYCISKNQLPVSQRGPYINDVYHNSHPIKSSNPIHICSFELHWGSHEILISE